MSCEHDEAVLTRKERLTGKFGEWTIVSDPVRRNRKVYYLCRCKCGEAKHIESYGLSKGRSRMCRRCSASMVGANLYKGPVNTWLYNKWLGIKSRCYNPNQHKSYKYYGALGIGMHEAWRSDYRMFESYILKVLGLPLNPYMTLDRIDVNGHYAPCNLRWATPLMQIRNRRKAVKRKDFL